MSYITTLTRANHYYDFEAGGDGVRLEYLVETPGYPSRKKIDWLQTVPVGTWQDISFRQDENMCVDRFLDTMVVKTNEVLRKMCIILLKNIGWNYHEYMYLIPMLDPTFDPPRINPKCRWQREFANSLVDEHFFGVVATCRNQTRLKKLYDELLHIAKKKY